MYLFYLFRVHIPQKRMKQKWNCCMSVPDSPDDPQSPTEPKCLMSLCKHKMKSPSLEQRPRRTHGHWSSAKIRVLFRVLGNIGTHRRRNAQNQASVKNNQVVPLPEEGTQEVIQTISNLVPASTTPNRVVQLPALAPPMRRRMISESELANALTILQQQQQRGGGRRPLPQYRRRRRSTGHRPKTPALSPIRESGLSNPASPSHQNCTVTAIPGIYTRP